MIYGLDIPTEPPAEGSTVTVTWQHRSGDQFSLTREVAAVDRKPDGYRLILTGTYAYLIADTAELAVYSHDTTASGDQRRAGVLTDINPDPSGDGDAEDVVAFLNSANAECRACGNTGRFQVYEGRAVCLKCGTAPDDDRADGGGM